VILPLATPATGAASQEAAPVAHSETTPLRVVLDTNVLVSLFVFADSRFAPFRQHIAAHEWIAYSREDCLDEFRRVLGYPMFKLDPSAQVAAFAAWQNLLTMPPAEAASTVALPRCQDRDDQKFLELARDAGADFLVTADKALLKLARRDKLRGLFRIFTPEAALELL